MRDIYAFWKTPKCSTGARVIQLKDSDERQSLQNGELQGRPRAVRGWLLTFLDGIQDPHCINISGHILSELLHPHFVRWGQIIYMLLALLLFGSFAHTQRLQTFVPLLFFFRTHHTLCWCSECSDRYKMSALHYFGPFSARCSFLESHQRQKKKIKERQNWDTGWERQHLTHDLVKIKVKRPIFWWQMVHEDRFSCGFCQQVGKTFLVYVEFRKIFVLAL